MSKRFGQNFLINRHQRERILDTLLLKPGMKVWEIGPGIGAMTGMALDRGALLSVFEIDHGFSRLLRRIYGNNPSFSLVEGDFLDTSPQLSAQSPAPDRVFGNLPYSAANAMVASLLEGPVVPATMVFTVQKEAARRMCARPGTKDYSAFSVLCTSICKVKTVFDIGASSFWPVPAVTSSVVLFTPRTDPPAGADRKGFSIFVRSLFASRRKTIRNNLKSWPKASSIPQDSMGPVLEEVLASMGKPADARAESLTPEELATLYRALLALVPGV